MYELIQLSEHDYYFDCPAKIGLVRENDTDVVLIDSGNDKDAAKKVLRVLEANHWHLRAVFNTHSHADHIGGNQFLQTKTGCRIYAPGIECDFTNHPILEPVSLWGGYPMKDLQHKFLMAQGSRAEPLTADVLPEGMSAVPLPGHCFDMVGFRTADGSVFLADCLSSRETLEKYGIGYLWDVEAYLRTLESVKTMEADWFVPAHAAASTEIAALAQFNIDAVQKAGEKIWELCGEGISFDALLQRVFAACGLTMTIQQHALIGSTVRSYLAWLQKQGKVQYYIGDNVLYWQAT